jgi:hypothetical protein
MDVRVFVARALETRGHVLVNPLVNALAEFMESPRQRVARDGCEGRLDVNFGSVERPLVFGRSRRRVPVYGDSRVGF